MFVKVPRRNLELKTPYVDLASARAALSALEAKRAGREVQTDTYFRATHGRLKLREIDGQSAVLIWYDRPDTQGTRLSQYFLLPVTDAALGKSMLTAALDVRGVVRKRREVYLWHNVRVHLDEVDGLGTFVELEAVLAPDDDKALSQARLDELCRVLKLRPEGHLAGSYADLLGM